MADAAKRKRLNRNFFDVVAKAKWMKEMQDNNLFGDDSQPDSPAPQITEISLRDITQAVDLTEFRKQNHENISQMVHTSVPKRRETCADGDLLFDKDKASSSCAGLEAYHESPDISPDDSSGDNLLSRNSIIDKTTGLQYSALPVTPADEDQFTYAKPVFERGACFDVISERETASVNENIYDMIDKADRSDGLPLSIPPRVPNGDLLSNEFRPKHLSLSSPMFVDINKSDSVESGKSLLNRHLSLSSTKVKDSRTFHPRKRQSVHGNRRENSCHKFDVDKFSKEELLLMWKASEMELSEKLEAAMKDKHRLETKLSAMRIQTSTPV